MVQNSTEVLNPLLVQSAWPGYARGTGGIHGGSRPWIPAFSLAISSTWSKAGWNDNFYLHATSWSSWGKGPICFWAQFPPLDPACCHRAFSLDYSQLISELVHEAISPSHPVINKCPVRGKIDGGPAAKTARLVRIRFSTSSHSSAKQGALGERQGDRRRDFVRVLTPLSCCE